MLTTPSKKPSVGRSQILDLAEMIRHLAPHYDHNLTTHMHTDRQKWIGVIQRLCAEKLIGKGFQVKP